MIVTHEQVQKFREQNTRSVKLPDGTSRDVRMTPDHWAEVEFLHSLEGITTEELSDFALEEMELQEDDLTFDEAFRMVVVHLANRWTS